MLFPTPICFAISEGLYLYFFPLNFSYIYLSSYSNPNTLYLFKSITLSNVFSNLIFGTQTKSPFTKSFACIHCICPSLFINILWSNVHMVG